jgi:DNA-binding transcriptional MerR regulator
MAETEIGELVSGLQVFDAGPGALYPLDVVVHLTGVARRTILIYCRAGLICPAEPPEESPIQFSEDAIYRIRRIEYLRSVHGINLAGLKMIFELMTDLEKLREEIRFLQR